MLTWGEMKRKIGIYWPRSQNVLLEPRLERDQHVDAENRIHYLGGNTLSTINYAQVKGMPI